MKSKCRLCNSETILFHSEFCQCKKCNSIQRINLPEKTKEKNRYDKHQNNILDAGYREFVKPITDYVFKNFDPSGSGLDFGCGPSSAISHILKKENYSVQLYDPFYFPDDHLLKKQYDYIIACEVIEHFHKPIKEFERLKKMLHPNGILLFMTHVFDEHIDFNNWYYKNDFTHVFFYSAETFDWIKKHFGFKNLEISGRFIILKS